jgi:hypothetical protein
VKKRADGKVVQALTLFSSVDVFECLSWCVLLFQNLTQSLLDDGNPVRQSVEQARDGLR